MKKNNNFSYSQINISWYWKHKFCVQILVSSKCVIFETSVQNKIWVQKKIKKKTLSDFHIHLVRWIGNIQSYMVATFWSSSLPIDTDINGYLSNQQVSYEFIGGNCRKSCSSVFQNSIESTISSSLQCLLSNHEVQVKSAHKR